MLYSHFIKTGIFFPRVRREIHWTHEINKTYKPREVPKTFKPGKVPLKGYRCSKDCWWEETLRLDETPESCARDVAFTSCCSCLGGFWGRHLPLSHIWFFKQSLSWSPRNNPRKFTSQDWREIPSVFVYLWPTWTERCLFTSLWGNSHRERQFPMQRKIMSSPRMKELVLGCSSHLPTPVLEKRDF